MGERRAGVAQHGRLHKRRSHPRCLAFLRLQMGLRGQVKHLENMLRAAHEAKKQWRERALQVGAPRPAALPALAQLPMLCRGCS